MLAWLSLTVLVLTTWLSISFASNSIHGGTYLAMAGKDSVVLVSDSRFSSQTGTMLGKHPRMIIRAGLKCLIGCYGLDADARTLMYKLRNKLEDQEESLEPVQIARLVSDVLYANNFIISPIITGLTRFGKPYICSMDSLGAQTSSDNFAVMGTASEGLFALCESLYLPNLETPELVQLAERCFNLAMQRDVLSGGDFRIITLNDGSIFVKNVEKMDV